MSFDAVCRLPFSMLTAGKVQRLQMQLSDCLGSQSKIEIPAELHTKHKCQLYKYERDERDEKDEKDELTAL